MRRVVQEMIDYNKNQVRKVVFRDWKRLNDTRKEELHNYFKRCDFGGYFGQDLLDLLEVIKTSNGEPDPLLNSMKAFMLMGDLMGDKQSIADAVKYKERIVFATMKNAIPDWQQPDNWERLNDTEKLEVLNKIQEQ
tara:strand:- start:412 stop:819 length:408 start_codon:yes stop_codon:yes gene_type:complete